MEAKTYSVSKAYDCTDKPELLAIIAILRRFREISATRLLDWKYVAYLSLKVVGWETDNFFIAVEYAYYL